MYVKALLSSTCSAQRSFLTELLEVKLGGSLHTNIGQFIHSFDSSSRFNSFIH